MSAKHNQIANHLITDILDGSYRVGERLPSTWRAAAVGRACRGQALCSRTHGQGAADNQQALPLRSAVQLPELCGRVALLEPCF